MLLFQVQRIVGSLRISQNTLCLNKLRVLYSSLHEGMTDLYSSLQIVVTSVSEQGFSQVVSGLVGLLQDFYLLAYIVSEWEFEHSGHTENLLTILHLEIEYRYFITLFKSHQKAAFSFFFLGEIWSTFIDTLEGSDGFLA